MIETFSIIAENKEAFFEGLKVTLKICILVWSIGLSAGVLLSVISYNFPTPFYKIFQVITFIFLSIPLLVVIYWLHYPLQNIFQVVIDPFFTIVLSLAILNALLSYQVISNALISLPKQYINIAKLCGMKAKEILVHIQFPLVLRQSLPGLLIIQVFVLQSSIFGSLISVEELFRMSQRVNSIVQKPIEIYSGMAVFFVGICLPLYFLAYRLYQKYNRDYSEM